MWPQPRRRLSAGRDILGRGQTGSGKTLAFGLALLTRLTGRRAQPKRPLGLVLVPCFAHFNCKHVHITSSLST